MKLWMIVGDCGDYYCGCGVGHLAAITADKSKIPAIMEAAKTARHHDGEYLDFPSGVEVIEVDDDTLYSVDPKYERKSLSDLLEGGS